MGMNRTGKISATYSRPFILNNTNCIWVDSQGKLRFKSSSPSSDTDGSVIGVGESGTATVNASSTSVNITFATTKPNTNYSVSVAPSWNTTFYVTNKTTTGFTINFGTAPGSSSPVDWTVRQN